TEGITATNKDRVGARDRFLNASRLMDRFGLIAHPGKSHLYCVRVGVAIMQRVGQKKNCLPCSEESLDLVRNVVQISATIDGRITNEQKSAAGERHCIMLYV